MVRLKGVIITQTPTLMQRFQFHNGTIKSSQDDFVSDFDAEFQFHNGTIKRS